VEVFRCPSGHRRGYSTNTILLVNIWQTTVRGDTLNKLLDQSMGILRSLQAVTSPEEKEAVEEVKGVSSMPDDMNPADISRLSDTFVGSAVVKNCHPVKGRFKVARDLAPGLRGEDDSLCLNDL